jgi:hypothetical protein
MWWDEMDGHARIAWTVVVTAVALLAANFGYGLAHEAAHATVIDAVGGHVYGIYVNAFGTDAYTEHTVIPDATDLVLVNVAGLCMTSLLAFVFAVAGQGLLAAFMGIRTSIYALNYAPGTDISTIHATVGSLSVALSLLLVAINLTCVFYAVTGMSERLMPARKRLIAGLSSSLSRARPVHNN